MKHLKKILNKIAILLYNKTKEEIHSPEQHLGGLRLIESPLIPEGQCIMSTIDIEELKRTFIDREINEQINILNNKLTKKS